MKDMNADTPSKPFGGPEEITFTPDSKAVIFSARDVGPKEPWSTDFDLYLAPIDASTAPKCLTEDNEAWDTCPLFSPDGKTLAYLAMTRPGYESDRLRIVLRKWALVRLAAMEYSQARNFSSVWPSNLRMFRATLRKTSEVTSSAASLLNTRQTQKRRIRP